MKGYVQIYTGDGKGKTTAAIGLALRAAGAGLSVFLAQFLKEGSYSEIRALERFQDLVTCRQYGSGEWVRGEPTDREKTVARQGLDEVRRVLAEGRHDLVILDESIIAAWFGLFSTDELIALIESKPSHVELVLTGRRADPRLIERADLVTEMIPIKHYYDAGVKARKGVEI
ncbi:cob(I)yrinic acid a,c-diamide adenosyltransferase [bacterium]|nr:cob(I)yrinic acid a,c-diamide adenosyltransferase [bacterium]